MRIPTPMQWLGMRGKWAEDAKYWKIVPPASMVVLLAGIFCLFASFGLVITMVSAADTPIGPALIMSFMTGCFGMGFAYAGFSASLKMIIAVALVEVVSLVLFSWLLAGSPSLSASVRDLSLLRNRLRLEGVLSMALIVLGFVLMTAFIRKEGLRVFGPMMEIKLATEVHRALVPSISRQICCFEICGASVPSGAMGGDLVDLIANGGHWFAYVADVCGHGVPAGTIMAMVKSAVRMGSSDMTNLSALLSSLNRVLASSCEPNTFVTFACVSGGDSPSLQVSLAGHLPILHYRKRLHIVEERSVPNLPLAVLKDARFEISSIDCENGDLLAVVTDGLTEATDAQGQELGLEPLKRAILASADVPLPDLLLLLRDIALRRGKQLDDQTLLLVRRGTA